MHFLGVDGCKAGWLGVQLDENGQWDIGVVADALALWHRWATATLILIDIPIGLPDKSIKSRSCDREARRLLGKPGAASIFPLGKPTAPSIRRRSYWRLGYAVCVSWRVAKSS